MLFNIPATDAWSLASTVGVLAISVLLALITPMLRAGRVDPAVALRAESVAVAAPPQPPTAPISFTPLFPNALNHLPEIPRVAMLAMELKEGTMSPETITADPKPRDKRAFNAYRHGLAGQVLVITPQEDQAYRRHCEGIHQSFAPVGAMEADLVLQIANDRWRLNRAAAMENNLFAEGLNRPDSVISENVEVDAAFAMTRVWMEKSQELARLTLYESRIQRRIEKNIALLRQMQQDRRAAVQQIVEQAAILGETYDFPAEALPSQFVRSIAELHRLARHHRLLSDAKKPQRRAA